MVGRDGEGNGGGGSVDEAEEGKPWQWESDLCGCPKRLWPHKLLGRIMVGIGHTYKSLCRTLRQFMSVVILVIAYNKILNKRVSFFYINPPLSGLKSDNA